MNDDSQKMDKVVHAPRRAQVINCHACDLKNHYRYTREELIDRFYNPNGPVIKPCISDHGMDVIWLNYKLEGEIN
jgi:hypothetical protein